MAIRIQKQDNGIYTKDSFIIGQTITTTNTTPQVVYSIPTITNKGYWVTIRFAAADLSTAMNRYAGTVQGFYGRDTGNIIKIDNDIVQAITGFNGTTPSIRTVANTGSQTIDIEITGRASITLNWLIEFTVEYRT